MPVLTGQPVGEENARMDVEFSIGDKAVYPAHGVAEVVGLETREIGGNTQTFYILKILDSGMKIMIPKRNVSAVGLREVIGESDVKEVYNILKSKEIAVEGQTWNRRYREYMDKIKTGSVFEIAEVLRDLSLLKATKDLSFGERKMLDTARQLLVKEIAIAKGTKEAKIEQELDKIFGPSASAAAGPPAVTTGRAAPAARA
jgi:CarD family transcriptional regulator